MEQGDTVRDRSSRLDVGTVVEVKPSVGGVPVVLVHFALHSVEALATEFEIVSRRQEFPCPTGAGLDTIANWRDGAMNFDRMDREELVTAYNRMVAEYRGLAPQSEAFQPVNKFQDTRTGRNRCGVIAAALQRVKDHPEEAKMAKGNGNTNAAGAKAPAETAPKAERAPRTPAEPRLNVNSQIARVLKEQGFKRTSGNLTQVVYEKEAVAGNIKALANGNFEVKTPAGETITGKGHKHLEEVIKTGKRPAAVVEAEAAAAAKAKAAAEAKAAKPAEAPAGATA